MKIKDIIEESIGTVHPDHLAVQGHIDKVRDQGGYDRVYHMNRLMMAMAMADGKSTKPVDMDAASWVEKYNTTHPYTDEEHNMVHAAMATVPTDHKPISKERKSREPDDTHKVSPHPNPGPIRVKKKSK
jgi:hypothetical protein